MSYNRNSANYNRNSGFDKKTYRKSSVAERKPIREYTERASPRRLVVRPINPPQVVDIQTYAEPPKLEKYSVDRFVQAERTRERSTVDMGSSMQYQSEQSLESKAANKSIQVMIPDNIATVKERAALCIQKVWRGAFSRKQEKARVLNEEIRRAEMKAQKAIGELQKLRSRKENLYTVKTTENVPNVPVPLMIRKSQFK